MSDPASERRSLAPVAEPGLEDGRAELPLAAPPRRPRPRLRTALRAFQRSPAIAEGSTPPVALRRQKLYRQTLGLADAAAAGLALAVVVALGANDSLTLAAILPLPLVVGVSKVVGLYDRDEHLLRKTTLDEAPRLFQVATLFTLLTWLGEGFIIDGRLDQDQVAGLWGFLFAFMILGRLMARNIAARATAPERCVVIGDEDAATWVRAKLDSKSAVSAFVVGRVPLADHDGEAMAAPPGDSTPMLGGLDELDSIIAEQAIERAIVAPDISDSETILGIIRLVKSLGINISILPRLFEVVGSSVEFDELEGTTLLGLRRYGLTRSSRLVKRGVDLIGASIAVALLSPLLLIAGLAIKTTSPGPVLFRQLRMGREEQVFSMLKFRTMVDGAEQEQEKLVHLNQAIGLFKIADDPRLTQVGRVLRRLSLDELPQLFNVLRGEMSLVGPRPLPLTDDDGIVGWQRDRLELPPGMTGLWQVLGGPRIPRDEMVKIDYLYGTTWSLWLDVKILLRTVSHVFARRGL